MTNGSNHWILKSMLLSIVWRNARDEWRKETHEESKLSMLKLAMECDAESTCFPEVKV